MNWSASSNRKYAAGTFDNEFGFPRDDRSLTGVLSPKKDFFNIGT